MKFINLKDITYDEYFKLSSSANVDFSNSIKNYGVLKAPILLQKNKEFFILEGHNRLLEARVANLNAVECEVLDDCSKLNFVRLVLQRDYQNSMSFLAKIKAVCLYQDYFQASKNEISLFIKQLHLGLDEKKSQEIYTLLKKFPVLYSYCFDKNVPVKFLGLMDFFSTEDLNLLNFVLENVNLRINIFKKIFSLLLDIKKREGNILFLENILTDLQSSSEKITDDALYQKIYSYRNPQYSELQEKISEIIELQRKKGIEVNVPPFLEGNDLKISFKINKNDKNKIEDILNKKIAAISVDHLKELFELF